MAKPAPSIAVKDLSYKFQDGSEGLEHVTLDLPAGSRTLLIGGTSLILHPTLYPTSPR
jgi:ABC-type phosphate/phosphonate transport system ATPase subunit